MPMIAIAEEAWMADDDERTLIQSRNEFHAALRTAFAAAADAGCREIWLCDDDYADWPLSERRVLDDLTRWAESHRSLTVIARQFDAIVRRHARWAEWRRVWSHVVQCRSNDELEAGQMPCLLLAPGAVSVRLVDVIHHRGSVSREAADAIVWRETIDAVLQRSQEAFPATTLGL
jgi:peptidyl-tRNA hydrolase